MSDDRRNVTVYRRDSVALAISFSKALPDTWEELQVVFLSETGSRLSKFVKKADVSAQACEDGNGMRYAFSITIDGTDPIGTFSLSEGAVRLHDGFIIRWNPDAENKQNALAITVDYTPERIVAKDVVATRSAS